MTFETIYKHIGHPWLSKSKMSMYMACPYKYYLTYILGVSYKQKMTAANMGTIVHEVFDKFFDYVDFDKLLEMQWKRITPKGKLMDVELTPVYRYFIDILLLVAPKRLRGQDWMKTNLKSFAMLEELHWHSVRSNYELSSDIRRYWNCGLQSRERFYIDEVFMFTGTIDRIINDFSPSIVIISDYKTGKSVPKPVREDILNGIYSTKLPSRYVFEGNFYCLLYLLNNNYTFDINPVDDKRYFYKDGKIQKTPKIDFSFIFTNTGEVHQPFMIARKKMSITTVRRILKIAKEIRACKEWPKCANQYVCGWCPILLHECKKDVKDKFDFVYYPDAERKPVEDSK